MLKQEHDEWDRKAYDLEKSIMLLIEWNSEDTYNDTE